MNPNITTDIVMSNPDKPWDWEELSDNPFTYQRNLLEKQERIAEYTKTVTHHYTTYRMM